MCGRRASLHTRNGISVGWGDKYAWNLAYQWIDITGLPGGTYTIRAAVDLYGLFTEKVETNNCAYARIRFGSTGSTLHVIERGQGCPNDHASTIYAEAIAWAREAGISDGCDADMFCTNNPVDAGPGRDVPRAGVRIPAVDTDYFTDDEATRTRPTSTGSPKPGSRRACAVGRYCPDKRLTRAARGLHARRALALPAATEDHFDDDDGTDLRGPDQRARRGRHRDRLRRAQVLPERRRDAAASSWPCSTPPSGTQQQRR